MTMSPGLVEGTGSAEPMRLFRASGCLMCHSVMLRARTISGR